MMGISFTQKTRYKVCEIGAMNTLLIAYQLEKLKRREYRENPLKLNDYNISESC